MSFFDEADEPLAEQPAPRRRRQAEGGRRPAGGGRRPPTDRQVIQIRRGVAAVAILIVVVLVVLGVHGCEVSQRNSALKDYNDNVATLNQESDQTGQTLFRQLSTAGGASNATNLQSQIDGTSVEANSQLNHARALSVPDEMKGAQQDFVLAMQMRRDGIADIAQQIQPALNSSTGRDAVNQIAAEMARFYASDVVYKSYALPLVVAALHNAGIAVGGVDGETVNQDQFLPDVQWLAPAYIATQLHVGIPTSSGKPAPGLHGHSLDSVSVGGTTLQTGSPNTIPASPPPTFTLHFTNGGHFTETNVVLKVSVNGTSVSGQTVVPQTAPGESTTGDVTLSSSPSAGTYTVTATVEPVPGEQNTSNNSLSFPVTFQ